MIATGCLLTLYVFIAGQRLEEQEERLAAEQSATPPLQYFPISSTPQATSQELQNLRLKALLARKKTANISA